MKRLFAIAILIILAVLACFLLLRQDSSTRLGDRQEAFDLEAIRTALSMFEVDCGRYPTTAEGLGALIKRPESIPQGIWHGPYMEERKVENDRRVKSQVAGQLKVPTDFWGRPYVYVFPGKHNPDGYDVFSLGRNGKGGDDAIGNWTPMEAEVVVYTSQDEVYAEPILKDFEKQTGIRVKTVFDSEAVKTVGLVNRLLQEKSNPQCDVFWNNEEFRTRQLAARGVFRDSNGWTHLGYRTRRMVVNTNLIKLADAPRAWSDVTNKIWARKVALAYPLFGTTSTHFLALRQHWGDAAWQDWCRALAANQPFVVDGNSVVVKQVARGEAAIGMADSDDIADAQQEGAPVVALPVTPETLFLPNTVGVIKNCPHPGAAQRLYEFLSDKTTSQKLVEAHALEGATLEPSVAATGLSVNWEQLLLDLDQATDETGKIFLR
jgi:iron(III) transport system substrate-binding protein